MKLFFVISCVLAALCSAKKAKTKEVPIDDLLKLAYSINPTDAPKDCALLPGNEAVYRCNNGTSPLLKISSFTIDKYPLTPGHTNFNMVYKLTDTIEKGSTLHIRSYSDMHEEIFDGEVDLCDYLTFANIECPVSITDGFTQMKQTLEIPDDVPPGVYSFVATARNHKGEEFIRVASNINLENKHYGIQHDEL